jgi:hypothetical protein
MRATGTNRSPKLSVLLMLVLIGGLFGGSIVAVAQDRGERAPVPTPSTGDDGRGDAAPTKTDQAKSEVRQEKGEKVKAFQFSGLDIEGQLKSPQMLYFLNRLRAEFGRPRLPHRSFMPELQRSTKGKSF